MNTTRGEFQGLELGIIEIGQGSCVRLFFICSAGKSHKSNISVMIAAQTGSLLIAFNVYLDFISKHTRVDDDDDNDDDDDDDGDRVRCARGDRGGNEGKRECQHHLHRLGRPHHDCE